MIEGLYNGENIEVLHARRKRLADAGLSLEELDRLIPVPALATTEANPANPPSEKE